MKKRPSHIVLNVLSSSSVLYFYFKQIHLHFYRETEYCEVKIRLVEKGFLPGCQTSKLW